MIDTDGWMPMDGGIILIVLRSPVKLIMVSSLPVRGM
jgi:hypothetical protein